MQDSITSVLNALLGADFPKVAGLVGLLLILLGVIPGEIRLGWFGIPKRDPIGRGVAIFLGTIFVMVPLLSLQIGHPIGLINVSGGSTTDNAVNPSNLQPTSGLLFGSARAGQRAISYTVTQRTVVDISKSLDGSPAALYAGDVHLSDPTQILVFKSMGPNRSKIQSGKEFSESEIRGMLSEEEIVLLDTLKQGDLRTFTYAGNAYVLKVDRVIWYLFGDDIVNVSIISK